MKRSVSIWLGLSLICLGQGSLKASAAPCAGRSCEARDDSAQHEILAQTSRSPRGVTAEPADDAAYVFDQDRVHTYYLTIDRDDLAAINARPSAEKYVPATLRFEDVTMEIAVRYKGSVGAFLAPCTNQQSLGRSNGPKIGKCSIKLSFNEIDDDGRFYGLTKLNLHAMQHDESMMKERLGYQLFRQMGIAAPRATHARVVINGELEGLFVAVEEVDKRFARGRFQDGGGGNVYKEVWPVHESASRYRNALETNKGSNTDVDRMIGLKRAIDEGAYEVDRWFDWDYMMRYMAVDRVIMNDDGAMHFYCGSGNHNYFWYESEYEDRMWLIPWDLDSSLSPQHRVHIVQRWSDQARECRCMGNQTPSSCDPLTAIIAQRLDEYEAAVDALIRGPFAKRRVDAALNRWAAQIEPFVEEATGVLSAPDPYEWQEALDTVRRVIDSARQHEGYDYRDEEDDRDQDSDEDSDEDDDEDW